MPGNYQEPQPQKSPIEVILNNIINGAVCIFLIAISFFIIVMVVSLLNNQTAVQYSNYTNDFAISNPLMNNVIYTSNPLLDNIVVSKYNATNGTFGGIPDTDWLFNGDTSAIEIIGGMEHTITSVRVDAKTTYAPSPHLSVLTMWSIALIIMSIASLFGIFAYSQYKKRQETPDVGQNKSITIPK